MELSEKVRENSKHSGVMEMIKSAFLLMLVSVFMSNAALAAGGLDTGTSALNDLKSWLFTAVGVMALIYLLYCCAMAFMERKSWGEVGMALVYCALAGGAVVGGTWALGLWS